VAAAEAEAGALDGAGCGDTMRSRTLDAPHAASATTTMAAPI